MASKYVWSKDRPQKPIIDPLLKQITKLQKVDKRSTFQKADTSGLSTSTIRNWGAGKVRRPQGVSLQMAARDLGYKVALVPINGGTDGKH